MKEIQIEKKSVNKGKQFENEQSELFEITFLYSFEGSTINSTLNSTGLVPPKTLQAFNINNVNCLNVIRFDRYEIKKKKKQN